MSLAEEARTTPVSTDELRRLADTFAALASVYAAAPPPAFDADSYYAGFRAGSRSAFADAVLRLQTLAEFGGGE